MSVAHSDVNAVYLVPTTRSDGGRGVAVVSGVPRVLSIDLSGLRNDAELEALLATTLEFPHEFRGLDAVIDLMSDLAWLASEDGFLALVGGFDECAAQVAHSFASLVPAVVDRFRSGDEQFVAVLACSRSRAVVLEALEQENAALARFGRSPHVVNPTGPVPVRVCDS